MSLVQDLCAHWCMLQACNCCRVALADLNNLNCPMEPCLGQIKIGMNLFYCFINILHLFPRFKNLRYNVDTKVDLIRFIGNFMNSSESICVKVLRDHESRDFDRPMDTPAIFLNSISILTR